MANENNKNNRLVSPVDEDPTSDFEIPASLKRLAETNILQQEVDENTFDVDKHAAGQDASVDSMATPGEQSKNQSEHIEQLQFEIEQLLSRVNGLDREISVREEISTNISQEYKAVKQKYTNSKKELQDRRHEIDFLQHALTESAKSVTRVSANNERRQEEAAQEIRYYRTQLEEQTGLAASNLQEMRDLANQAERTEKYADSLRVKLQSLTYADAKKHSSRRGLEQSLEITQTESHALTEQLADEQQQNQQLKNRVTQLEEDYAREIRQLRFELGSAQETISSKDGMNEQLASDLIDNQGFRQALESKLGEIEENNLQNAQKLTRQLRKAQQEADEYERKMRAKDKAIAALMSELANPAEHDESAPASDNPLSKIDGYAAAKPNLPARTPRVAKLLIGKSDGRDLRFPLFKDRLTIGRTANNDIQLNVRYISRRHAVIVTDNGRTRLVDWGSKNGVYVNQERVAERFLNSGDVVIIGTTKFRYEERPKR
ncbi:MAG: chromosome segregation ATPase [Woeseiaceae bacterium]|jgi:chromosome segregation ATPase